MTADVHRDPAVRARLRAEGIEPEPTELRLRGLAEPVGLYRVSLTR
jgi:hypothetical protein